MAQAFVMPTTGLGVGDRRALWVVLADTPDLAVETARASDCNVDRIVGTLCEETLNALGSSLVKQSFSKRLHPNHCPCLAEAFLCMTRPIPESLRAWVQVTAAGREAIAEYAGLL
jgi:hypothetical protein